MKLRNQLLVAFLLLSVLPLTTVVIFTYLSSQRALQQAYEAEAAVAASDLQERLDDVTEDLGSRFARAATDSFLAALEREDEGKAGTLLGDAILREFGDSADLLDRVEIVPAPRPAPAPPAPPGAPPVRAAPPEAPRVFAFRIEELIDPESAAELEKLEELGQLGGLGAFGRIVELSVGLALEATEASLEEVARQAEEGEISEEERAEIRAEIERARAEALEGLAESRRALREETLAEREAREEERAERQREESERRAEAARIAEEIRTEAARERVEERRALREEIRARREEREAEHGDSGHLSTVEVPLLEEGRVVGSLRGKLRAHEILERVFARSGETDEIPFAVDADGQVYASDDEDQALLEGLPLAGETGVTTWDQEWVIARNRDESSGLVVGIVRPLGESLHALRRTAVWNFVLGQGMVGLAVLAILFLSGRMTRQVRAVTAGAERIAQGDLQTRVPVRSRNELGQLARAFNRMAEDLSLQQQRLVAEEMRRRENELEQKMLRDEYDRKSTELEEARRFQFSLLPKDLPDVPGLDVAVHMRTAAEVGGDYYDFREEGGDLLVAIGDATGHGARAGTMVTILKSLFAAQSVGELPEFLQRADETVRGMNLGRMAMAFALARFAGRSLTVASAGMPPVLVRRAATGDVEDLSIPGTPLGSLAFDYRQVTIELEAGDTVLFMSDGFAELTNVRGETLGYERAAAVLASAGGGPPEEVLAALLGAGDRWTDGEPLDDDVTFLVFRVE